MQNCTKYINAFKNISSPDGQNIQEQFSKIEEFVCRMYGFQKINEVNSARIASFMKAYKVTDKEEIFRLPKNNIDESALPPCQSELQQHFLRSTYIAHLWTNAHRRIPSELCPEDSGWNECENKYIFNWFEGEQLPSSIDYISFEQDKECIEGIYKKLYFWKFYVHNNFLFINNYFTFTDDDEKVTKNAYNSDYSSEENSDEFKSEDESGASTVTDDTFT